MSAKIYLCNEGDEDKVVEMYQNGASLEEIQKEFNLPYSDPIYKVLRKKNVPLRCKQTPYARTKKICICGHKNVGEAKFCNMCGKQLKTEEEKIIDGLYSARAEAVKYAPVSIQKELDDKLLAAIKLLKKKCSVKE